MEATVHEVVVVVVVVAVVLVVGGVGVAVWEEIQKPLSLEPTLFTSPRVSTYLAMNNFKASFGRGQ